MRPNGYGPGETLPDYRTEPPPEREPFEPPEGLEKAQNAIRLLESAGIELAEADLLTLKQDAEWEYTLEVYNRLLLAAEKRAKDLAENEERYD